MSGGGSLFTNAAVASLSYWQRANMPDTLLVFTRSITRDAGAVAIELWAYARAESCRLSLSRAAERNIDGNLSESHTWTLARPADASPLDGTELLVVLRAAGGAITLRIASAQGMRTFQTVQKAEVTTDGVPSFIVGTSRRRGPALLRWGSTISISGA